MKKKLYSILNKLSSTGFFHVFGSSVINKILGFVSSVFIVRLISKYDYGVYTAALNIFSFFLLVSGMGMISGVLQVGSENAKDLKKNFTIYQYGSKVGIAFNVLLAFVIAFWAIFFPLPIEESNKILLLLSCIPIFEIANEFQKVYFRTRLDNKSYAYANSLGSFFVVLFSIIGAFSYGVIGLVAGRYVAAIVSVAVSYKLLKAPLPFGKSYIEDEDKKSLYKISLISMLNGGISELLYLFDIFVIGLVVLDPNAVADYKIAIIIPTALAFIPASICIYIYPYFSLNKDNKQWVKKHYNLVMLAVGGLNLAISLFLIIFAPLILEILFGAKYLSAVTMFRISSASYFFIGTTRIISGNILVTQRRLKFNFVVSVIAGSLNVLSNFILVNKMGAEGAAWTTLIISFLSGTMLTAYMFYVMHQIPEGENQSA